MTEHAVVIAGGGPTGLMLGGELALAGVDVAIIERRASQDLPGARAGGLHSRTIEVLDQRGIADRFLSEGQVAQVAGFAMTPLDISDFPTRHNYRLGLWQNHIERILAGWVGELAVPIYREREVTGFAQDDTSVDVELSDGQSLRAEYLVGCDGGRSLIRKAAGIEFPGWDPTTSALIAEAEMAEEPELGIRRDARGIHAFGRLEYEIRDGEVVFMDEGPVGVMVTEEHVGHTTEPTLRDLSEALIAVYGTDYGIHSPTWISRFTDMTRQAASYRDRRVLLAGDAAHVHCLPEGYTASLEAAYRAGMRPPPVEVFRKRRPMLIRDARQTALNTPFSSPLHRFLHEVPWDTIYFVPLVYRGLALGILSLYYLPGQEPGEDESVFLGAVADQTAVAVENVRLFAAAQDTAALEERQRLARELHDSVSQALYGIALGSRTARTLLDRERPPERVAEWLEYVLSLAEAGLTEMRALIFELRPESLESEGLIAALKQQAAALRARHEIAVHATLGEEPDLPLEKKEALYRIAQEALHNTVKHARASRAELKLECDARGITLEVSDDGAGFDPERSFSGRLGLKSMRERATRLGGTLRVESTPRHGTSIHARMPIDT